jgi:membrane-bound lytic murein transglycosylase A
LGALGLLGALLAACAKKAPTPELEPLGPPVAMESPEFFVAYLAPRNQDLASWKDMAPTVRKSLNYVNTRPQSGVAVQRPGLSVTWGEIGRTLARLQDLLPRLDAEPQLLLENFRWVEVAGGINYSGYYEPAVRASRTRQARLYPGHLCPAAGAEQGAGPEGPLL